LFFPVRFGRGIFFIISKQWETVSIALAGNSKFGGNKEKSGLSRGSPSTIHPRY
jgi:hypothetical protein